MSISAHCVAIRRAFTHATRCVALFGATHALAAQERPIAAPPVPSAAVASDTLPTLPGPAVRRIATAQAVSASTFGTIGQVRGLPDGRVLVNDVVARRLMLLDTLLGEVYVVLDSLSERDNFYGVQPGTLVTHRLDSSMFVDPSTLAMLQIDGQGRVTRVRAVPRSETVSALRSPTAGTAAIDARGRLVHRLSARAAPPPPSSVPGMPAVPQPPDTAFVVGTHLDTRQADTLGVVRLAKVVYSVRLEPEGYYSFNTVPNPLPLVDDWAVLDDGTIAFVRGLDYRVEFRAPDGTTRSGQRLPFAWQPLDDAAKAAFVDSMRGAQVKSAQTNYATSMIAWSNLLNKPYPASFTVPDGYVPPPGLPADWILPPGVRFPENYVAACPPGVTPAGGMSIYSAPISLTPPPSGPPAPGQPNCTQSFYSEMYGQGYTPPAPIYRAPTLVQVGDLPDYKPAFAAGAARADADGQLWVRLNLPLSPRQGAVYDIIDPTGTLADRIQLPAGHTLVGFGPGRVVYLTTRDASGLKLARVRLRPPGETENGAP
ncbi:MAG: hypothetical protein MUD17_09395 [Gemmatimonadaceae bacterium]|jgi:hypothetical protein|nr:hypothetical protein [Gemmatimonadaceae bacterium]